MKPAWMTWGRYLRAGLGNRLSRLGEKWHVDWLTYDRIHFRHFHDHALENAPAFMRTFAALFPETHRYVDICSGTGSYADEAQRQGRQIVACARSE